MTPEEKIAQFMENLWWAFDDSSGFSDSIKISLVTAAMPEVTEHFLKGQ